jgi:hypothetical protein
MKSFVLLGLVATGLAIPLTNTPAALDAADADTERAFKTGLAAIEKSLLDVSLTTHQREPTVVAQAKKCSWCGTSTSSTIPGYTGPEKIETIKNVNNDLCCLTCRNAMLDGMKCGAWINDGEGKCILKFVDPGIKFPTNVTYFHDMKSSAGIINVCGAYPPNPPDPPAPPPPPATQCYSKCVIAMDNRTDWVDIKTAACKHRCQGGRLHPKPDGKALTFLAAGLAASSSPPAIFDNKNALPPPGWTKVDPPAPPPPPMGSCFDYCYADYDLRDDWNDLKHRACDGQCGTKEGVKP